MQLKQMALLHDRSRQELLGKAMNNLFRKYKLPPIARDRSPISFLQFGILWSVHIALEAPKIVSSEIYCVF